jgi:hypothetical protein
MTEREKALREAAAIAGNAAYSGDYYDPYTDVQNIIARKIRNEILELIDTPDPPGNAL